MKNFGGFFWVTVSIFCLGMVPPVAASQAGGGYADGQRFASLQDNTLPQNPGDIVPGYAGINAPEVRLQSHTLSQKAKQEFSKEGSAGQFVLNSESDRHHFDINPQKDPLFIASKDAISNAHDYLNVTEEVFDEPTDYVEVKCYKPLEFTFIIDRRYTPEIFVEEGCGYAWNTRIPGSYLYPAARRRIVSLMRGRIPELTTDKIKEITQIRNGGSRGSHNYGTISGVYEVKTREVQENWTTSFYGFEDYFDRGDYTIIDEKIVEGTGTRSIEGVNVTADVWKFEQTYASRGPGADTCQACLDRGCVQVSSTCIEEVQGQCVRVENTFRCEDSVRRLKRSKLTGGNVFCLDGNCTDVSWEDNHDMLEALSKLALLQEMEKTLEDLRVFQGDVKKCSRHCWGFSDCCQLGGGWGESIGFTKCDPDEKLLSKLRSERKCHYVGSYCSEYIPLGFTEICIMRKKSYCCFESILLRLIQEQGRSQLGLGWGSGEHPVCRGLTAEEISRIDFDQLNLEEAFDDIRKSIEIPETSGVIDRFQSNWKKRLPQTQERILKQQEQGGNSWDLNLEEGESL